MVPDHSLMLGMSVPASVPTDAEVFLGLVGRCALRLGAHPTTVTSPLPPWKGVPPPLRRRPPQKGAGVHLQRTRDPREVVEGQGMLPTLERAQVAPIELGARRQLLLREPLPHPQASDVHGETEPRITDEAQELPAGWSWRHASRTLGIASASVYGNDTTTQRLIRAAQVGTIGEADVIVSPRPHRESHRDACSVARVAPRAKGGGST